MSPRIVSERYPMKLSRASSYALHALAYMAGQSPDKPVASHLVAEARGIPERFLLKVLRPLVSAQVLRSVRGPNGGYRLLKPAKQVTLLDVVEAVDGLVRGEAPAVGKNGGAAMDKRLQGVRDGAGALTRERLGKVTLADLAKGK
jgi:Rrf2 family protein